MISTKRALGEALTLGMAWEPNGSCSGFRDEGRISRRWCGGLLYRASSFLCQALIESSCQTSKGDEDRRYSGLL